MIIEHKKQRLRFYNNRNNDRTIDVSIPGGAATCGHVRSVGAATCGQADAARHDFRLAPKIIAGNFTYQQAYLVLRYLRGWFSVARRLLYALNLWRLIPGLYVSRRRTCDGYGLLS